MSSIQIRKNKVNLSEYNYQRDVQHRLFLSQASMTEIEIMDEIINSSLQFPICHLHEIATHPKNQFLDILKKLVDIRLIKIQNDSIIVDKEMRKYYEGQLTKFRDDFVPGIDYLRYLLDQVPISILPSWYIIPRTTDNIFQAIVEKCLITPKVYERYLEELQFDNPTLSLMYNEVFNASDFVVSAKELMQKFQMTHAEFEENMLLLEYHFVCCLSYRKHADRWEEIVTPFYEWREYLKFRRDTFPQSMSEPKNIQRRHPNDFGFIEDMFILLKSASKNPISIKNSKDNLSFDFKQIPQWLKNEKMNADYAQRLLEVILELDLAIIKNNQLCLLSQAALWMDKSLIDKASSFMHYVLFVEKSLSRIKKCSWIYLDDFMKGFVACNGSKEPIILKHKGKKWKYELPSYNAHEMQTFEEILYDRLFEAGVLAVGVHQGKKCIKLTEYGHNILSY
jgi:hypothetical protein